MSILKTGKEYKILHVKGNKGSQMPSHFSTKEAIIIVLKGEVLLKFQDKEMNLIPDDSAIIPASVSHSLFIKENFEAYVIMAIDSEIKFDNNYNKNKNGNHKITQYRFIRSQ